MIYSRNLTNAGSLYLHLFEALKPVSGFTVRPAF